MTHLDHVAARIIGRPLLILPQKLDLIVSVLAGRIGLDVEKPELGLAFADRPEPLASRFVGSRHDRDTGTLPYARTDAGVAIVTITGSLVNRGAWIGASSGLTSYEGIAAQIRAAMADPKVSSILLDLDTPGGEATGAFELAAQVRKANATKPVTAFVNGMAASAGYLIASGAGRIVSVPSGLKGSIGVVMFHADYSRALEKAGITPTLIHAGKNKVDGNPYAPLNAATKARLQTEVDGMREDFVKAVAAGRGGRMSAKAARDTEAAIYTGGEAKAIGLVDELATFDALYADLKRGSARTVAQPGAGRSSMEDIARARGEAAAEERVRIKTILTAPEAKGLESFAAHLAFDTVTGAKAAVAAMTAAKLPDKRVATCPVIDADAIYAQRNGRAPTPATSAGATRGIDAEAIYAKFNGSEAAAPSAGDRASTSVDSNAIFASRI